MVEDRVKLRVKRLENHLCLLSFLLLLLIFLEFSDFSDVILPLQQVSLKEMHLFICSRVSRQTSHCLCHKISSGFISGLNLANVTQIYLCFVISEVIAEKQKPHSEKGICEGVSCSCCHIANWQIDNANNCYTDITKKNGSGIKFFYMELLPRLIREAPNHSCRGMCKGVTQLFPTAPEQKNVDIRLCRLDMQISSRHLMRGFRTCKDKQRELQLCASLLNVGTADIPGSQRQKINQLESNNKPKVMCHFLLPLGKLKVHCNNFHNKINCQYPHALVC